MRGVGDELALRLDRALEPVGHLVERLPELLDLARAAHVAGAGGEVAVPQALRGGSQPRERPGQRSGEPEREQQLRPRARLRPIAPRPIVMLRMLSLTCCTLRVSRTAPSSCSSSWIGTAVAMMS